MEKLPRILIILFLLLAAVASYSYGSATGIFLFIILGFVFEMAFWFKVFPRKKKR
ncbi:hypothetical protein [Pseudoalteromonas sp. T1lg23B]|uniref:hypothetical protein n=1 Tax=Pseudoalteromonas sp. T1lg23B TaxID=2077097 RepID=UPI0018FED68B|nr:hypothetical protein [Pseudoalteromonas sp. T1lg23B]